ncbi:hypothetical protein AB833_04590 [Chromatiales bacterium (ex Bugula neritina AB1)]|nr:hypothetical protein AB833_04590 [Chromatiales bacterium (ex Bugula neritina AB1)]
MPSPLQPEVLELLETLAIPHTAIECDASLADTADFCSHYGYSPDQSANALVVGSKKGEPTYACCVVLANCRLDVNNTVRKKLGVKKLSFATPEITRELTGMELGGVTPISLPASLPLWVDSRVMECDEIIIGGGNRTSKILMPPGGLLKLPNMEVVENLANPYPAG